jgi:hypothetical protein
MIRNTKLTIDHLELLNKYVYDIYRNIVVAINSKVRLLISLALCKIHPKYFHLHDDTERNTLDKELMVWGEDSGSHWRNVSLLQCVMTLFALFFGPC